MPFLSLDADGVQKNFLLAHLTSIGRRVSSDIALDDASVASDHAQVVLAGNGFDVMAVTSGAALRLNGQDVRRSHLAHGDVLQVGCFTLRFSLLGAAEAPTCRQQTYELLKETLRATKALGGTQASRATLNLLADLNSEVMRILDGERSTCSTEASAAFAQDSLLALPSLSEIMDVVRHVGPTDVTVLLTGETGTGKEVIASALHTHSARSQGPFVVVNCGAIPENLIESELFGHVKGAFTGAVQTQVGKFQAAHQGTLFLDELGELPLPLQVRLLRVLQDQIVTKVGSTKREPIDIRVLAATNRNLREEVEQGRFREDLYYRLNVVHLQLPPLRERGDDVIVLAQHFLQRHAAKLRSQAVGLTPGARTALLRHEFPGNVRELENRVKRALIACRGRLITAQHLELEQPTDQVLPLAEAREAFQRAYIIRAVQRNGGNRSRAARELGIDPRTVFRYLQTVDMDASGNVL